MSQPTPEALFTAMEATWPAAETIADGPWLLRKGLGGGKRVSAATAEGPDAVHAIPQAQAAMHALGQTALFMLRPDETTLDTALAAKGYAIVDPVTLYAGPVTLLTGTPVKRMTAFTIWPPLAIIRDLWAAGGIGPARIAVMQRATGPKTAILARHTDQPAGVAFAACHGDIVMVHAIETVPALRRQGVGANMLRLAAHWGAAQGAQYLALAVTDANPPANALYASLGLTAVGHYHYRMEPQQEPA